MLKLIFLFFTSFLLGACSNQEQIQISGSTTVLPIVSKASEKFQLIHPEVRMIVNAGGSGVGINQAGAGQVEFGMASRNLTKQEQDKFPNLTSRPIAIDAVIPVVSSELFLAGIDTLSLIDIARIYSGQVQNWKELGGPDMDILCIDKEKSRGTRHVFMKAVFGNEEAPAKGADLVLGGNNEEQTALAQSKSAIGMLSLAWLNDDVRGVTLIDNNGRHHAPTREALTTGTYPLQRTLDLLYLGEPNGWSKSFLDFLLSEEGQSIVNSSGYVGAEN